MNNDMQELNKSEDLRAELIRSGFLIMVELPPDDETLTDEEHERIKQKFAASGKSLDNYLKQERN